MGVKTIWGALALAALLSAPAAAMAQSVIKGEAAYRERMSYAVRGKVLVGDRPMFTTDEAYPVLTHGAGTEVTLLLVKTSGPQPARSAPS